MNILIVLPVANYSGSAIALLRVVKILIKLGWTVEMFSMRGPILQDFLNLGVVSHDKFPIKKYSYVVFNSLASIGIALKVWRFLDSSKIILWLHEDENFLRLMNIKLSDYAQIKFDNLIYPSECLYDFSKKFSASERTHFNNVVDVPFDFERNDGSLCVVGPYEPRKNQDFILNNSKYVNILKFIGRDVFKINGSEKLILFQELSPSECIAQISNSLALISASYFETQNLVALEAIQAGKPVLLSNIAAHRILSKRFSNVELFDLNDVNGYRLGLEKLYEHANNRERCFANSEFARSIYGEKRAELELKKVFKNESS
jgi:glycosyltransferase involved in cell wall biosynthesis